MDGGIEQKIIKNKEKFLGSEENHRWEPPPLMKLSTQVAQGPKCEPPGTSFYQDARQDWPPLKWGGGKILDIFLNLVLNFRFLKKKNLSILREYYKIISNIV